MPPPPNNENTTFHTAVQRLTESDFFLQTGRLLKLQPRGLGKILGLVLAFWNQALRLIGELAERFIPSACQKDPEAARRARLTARFGILGTIFGSVFAIFYAVVSHFWGAGIVLVCSAGFAGIPWLMRRTQSVPLAGHSLCAILIIGFAALCGCEGGSEGHAIAWLVSVPLCALLLVGRKAAGTWAILSFAAGAGVVAANMLGWKMHPTYPESWHPVINAAGYLALIMFMFLLGVIFESGRERAFTKMSEANAKLATSNEQLARLNQEKNEFLGIAAHDLKNPLTVIIGTAELLKMNSLPPAQATKFAGNIVGAGQRMFQLIKDLLDANAIEQGKFTSNIERCDLRALAAECVANNQPHATRKEIVICTEEGGPVWGRADRNATMQILDNLISNAVKFSPQKSTVQVIASLENGHISISVKDHGPGLSDDDQKKLFGKFARLSAQPTGGESSTGLGLSIVKKLAEAMSGTVFCRSKLGEGATFVLRLPEWDEEHDAPAITTAKQSAQAAARIPAALDRDVACQAPGADTKPVAAKIIG
ncbi:MAG: HAMP domain-containing sensor histidine kinase [Verrucomicrobiota bacterium]